MRGIAHRPRSRWSGWWEVSLALAKGALLLGVPLCLTFTLSARQEWNPQLGTPAFHFYVVSAVALLALATALSAAWVAVSARDVRLSLLTVGFLGIGAIMSVHGLATPGFLLEHGYHGTTAASGYFAHVVGAWMLWLSTVGLPRRASAWLAGRLWLVLVLAVAALGGYAALALGAHELFQAVPVGRSGAGLFFTWGLLAVDLVLLTWVVGKTFLSHLLSRAPLPAALGAAALLLMASQVTLQVTQPWTLAWWLYHFYLLLGVGAVVRAVAAEYLGGKPLAEVFHQLSHEDVLAQVRQGLDDAVLALAAAAEARDRYTFEHVSRVAELAVLIGRAMGLPRLRLRALAQGAMLHDVGKLYISDLVLQKPDKLTSEEFALIKQHPALGYELLMRLKGFEREALVVRHHHEWYDGSGYPDGLRGEEIPLEARIVAVADMYDALTTDRPYRRAYSHEEALAIMERESGTHLDPACVEAFRRALGEARVLSFPSAAAQGKKQLSAS
jgi:hypothetical protein